ncbi:hypothetical protein EWM62_08760 [Mucilaginibacter terrigena]|uniref:Uncharacterized protein n=1 Tax=Mucilaginibacter terrigena TaxID=2492395 RepID=A0A4Q5LMC3_9SPHI|nr:hypothetical protein [Mucilaginibacter terrigena]RYU90727.1 hypothetical protein EWM62_08760 [Mucilaginibacter terrigena]
MLNVIFFNVFKKFGIELEYYLSNGVKMVIEKKTKNTGEEKEWENPQAPEKTSDERDKEQLARQYKEAKRRHDNLSENQGNENKEETKQ